MKTGFFYLGLILSVLSLGVVYGAGEPQGVPWAEWRFAGDFDPAHEMLADKSSDPDSLIRRNPASAAISLSDGKVVFTQTGPDDYLRVDVDDLAENGGGGYVNEYTMVFDLKATNADWLPIYNTNYNNQNAADFWVAADGAVGSGSYSDPGVLPLNTWVRLVVVRRLEDGSWVRDVYIDGTKVLDNLGVETLDDNSSLYTNAQQDEGQFTILSDADATAYAGCELDNFAFVAGALSDAEVADLGAYRTQGIFGVRGLASEPAPADRATDVPCDSDLGWTPDETARTHDVYLGTNWDDVNDAGRADPRGVLVSQDQEAAAYVPEEPFEYGRTYFWRIDEVNGAPDYTVFKGDVWSFTTEPYAYPVTSLTVKASGEQETSPAVRTIDGSGLDEFDQHGVDVKTMWLSSLPAWIQYTFDTEQKLHELWVWNANSEIESIMGFGARDVTIEYSTDGETWTRLENVPQFAQGTGTATYTANTVVDFGGVMAKHVKLTVDAAWGSTGAAGLSEVRFFYVPLRAFGPDPASGATGVSLETELNWRPGRGMTSHTVYIDKDGDAVAGGTAAAHTVTDHSYTPSSLDFATQYFWRVDEIGDSGTYAGDLWSFTTEEFAVVDDFESYTDNIDAEETIYQAWTDGVTNGTGSYVGYENSKNGTFGETAIVHGGRQSMPLTYDNTKSPYYSEARREFDSAQNWTVNGADTLSLYFRGAATNSSEPLYVTVKDNSKSATVTHSNAAATTVAEWQQWKIPLSDFTAAGVKATAVKGMVIGVGNKTAAGTGIVYIDDIGYGRPLQ
jgi:hypothetical protein